MSDEQTMCGCGKPINHKYNCSARAAKATAARAADLSAPFPLRMVKDYYAPGGIAPLYRKWDVVDFGRRVDLANALIETEYAERVRFPRRRAPKIPLVSTARPER
jgi:hypothetical protein